MKPTITDINWAMSVMNTLFSHGFHDAIIYHLDEYDSFYGSLGLYDWECHHSKVLNDLHVVLHNGETKVCIIGENDNWVIKVGFDRTTSPRYVAREIAENFCKKEADYYAEACELGIEDCFAATYKIGEVDNTSIFLQEYAANREDDIEGLFFDYASSTDDYYPDEDEDQDSRMDRLWSYVRGMDDEERIFAVLGENNTQVLDFIFSHEINDLHQANWGVTNDGRCVMIDYSGYKG